MFGEDNKTINNPMMEQMMAMLNNLSNNVIDINNNINNNMNSLKTDMNKITKTLTRGSKHFMRILTLRKDCYQEHLQEQRVSNSS
jgi:hypothetical protein